MNIFHIYYAHLDSSLTALDAPRVEIIHSLEVPQEGQYLKLECMSKGNPS